jgi:hypothetical protein
MLDPRGERAEDGDNQKIKEVGGMSNLGINIPVTRTHTLVSHKNYLADWLRLEALISPPFSWW